MRAPNLIACGLLVLSISLAPGRADPPAPASPPQPVKGPATPASGKIAATVNGEPIAEQELLAALPADAFEATVATIKESKLKRLIETTLQDQFLKANKVQVSDKEIDEGIKTFRVTVTTPGCPCCGGGYANMEQFMEVNAFSMSELRRKVANDLGYKVLLDRRLQEHLAPERLAQTVRERRAEIEKGYVRGWVIHFNYDQDMAKREKLARQAWGRLEKGEAFEDVAKSMSEDKNSAPKGGYLGPVPLGMWGGEVEAVWRKLAPGAYSAPVKTWGGYCIVKRDKLTEDDIVSLAKEQMQGYVEDRIYDEYKAMREKAVILDESGRSMAAGRPGAASSPAGTRGP